MGCFTISLRRHFLVRRRFKRIQINHIDEAISVFGQPLPFYTIDFDLYEKTSFCGFCRKVSTVTPIEMKQGRPRVQRVELRGCMALTFWIEPGRDALAIWQTRRDGTRSPYGERAGTGLARHMASGLGRDALTICRAGRDRTPSPYGERVGTDALAIW